MKSCFLVLAMMLTVANAGCGEPPPEQPRAAKPANANKSESHPDAQAAAEEFIALAQHEQFDQAARKFDATMREALPAGKLQALWQATVQAHGALQKVESGQVSRANDWDVVDLPCVFEKSDVVIRISLNQQREVGGLFVLSSTARHLHGEDGPEIQLQMPTGTLFGTLDLPTGKGPWPVALIIAGSGPTDRDGNSVATKNDSLRLLGKALAAQGVAALRYDKRGVGKSAAAGPVEENLRFENYVDDAAGWIAQLRGDPRFSRVVIVGHSEGSLIGILVAQRLPIDALVSVAGAGRDLATMLRDQLQRNLPANSFDESTHIIDELLAGRSVENVPMELAPLFRPSVQPYLKSWLPYNPAKEIAGVPIPVLIVQGTTDVQISLDDAKLLAESNKNARLVTIDGMNHVLKSAPLKLLASQTAAYSDPSLPLADGLVAAIVSFLQGIGPAEGRATDSR